MMIISFSDCINSSFLNLLIDYTCSTCYNCFIRRREHERQRFTETPEAKWMGCQRIHGSHHILEKDGQIETVPIHGKEVPIGLLNTILKRTGLK